MYCLTRKTLKCNKLVQKICMFLQKETSHCKHSLVLSSWGPKLNWKKFTNSWEFGPHQVKWSYMFPSIKMEEYIAPEPSGIFWAKTGRQKYSAWVPRDTFYSYEGYKYPQGYWNVLYYFDFEYFFYQTFCRKF